MLPASAMNDGLQWRKAARSIIDGACVEVADRFDHCILVRDSKNRGGEIVLYTARQWRIFIAKIAVNQLTGSILQA